MTTQIRKFPPNAFRICVDTVGVDIAGRIYSPMSSDVINFVSVGEILVKMDELFDKYGYPQAFQDKRSFDNYKEQDNLYKGLPKTIRPVEDILSKAGKAMTYDMIVKSRQNTSWQGNLYDSKGNNIKEFDGEVEILALLADLMQQ